ncbi:F-box/kelch-repeat protein At3g23880-like [Punica granatum]|uniref:F-box domain-containing protein n=2 Tax=Punica granatum TaxID=22663 RepID=A0A218W674_PUNGR|nr:F-box/kelch-repeat protein At3g23880-like [Punica granatum]OWM67582.1 hypothetical protein CDL15_Pgr024667 [Punica granatum]PKI36450.1 hypothetical protein CRG98_043158 [Punica granatum]
MAEISEEILTEILLRLPVKPLVRFKCVSKRWHSMISDPHFTLSQLRTAMLRNTNSCARVLLTGELLHSISIESLSSSNAKAPPTTVLELPVKSSGKDSEIAVVGSCDGLVCLLIDSESLVLWNPTIGECRELPSSEFARSDVDFFYGLGYDSKTNDYKVVRGHYMEPGGRSSSSHTSIEIFSRNMDSWRRVQYDAVEFRGTDVGAYADGSLHWLRGNESEPVNKIVSFDLSEEMFHETVPMTGINDFEKLPLEGLCVSGECLLVYRGCNFGADFEAWMMKWEGKESSWSKLCSVPRDALPFTKYWLNPIDFTVDGKVLFNSAGWELCLYDQKENALKRFDFENDWVFDGSATYVESLVSPHGGSKRS